MIMLFLLFLYGCKMLNLDSALYLLIPLLFIYLPLIYHSGMRNMNQEGYTTVSICIAYLEGYVHNKCVIHLYKIRWYVILIQ